MSVDHDLTVVDGCSVTLEAHGRSWTMEWDAALLEDLPYLECPQCRKLLEDTEGRITLGVCLGEAEHSMN